MNGQCPISVSFLLPISCVTDSLSSALLAGFRDPYVFLSPRLSTLLNGTASTTKATGQHFLTISSGVDGAGGKLLLYRQTTTGNVTGWTYLGPLFETSLTESWSSYSGSESRPLT